MRSVPSLADPSEGDAIPAAVGCRAGFRSGLPTGRRDGLADRGALPAE